LDLNDDDEFHYEPKPFKNLKNFMIFEEEKNEKEIYFSKRHDEFTL